MKKINLAWDPKVFKQGMIREGRLPEKCTMDGAIVMVETWEGRSTCHGCNEDREVCGGSPKGCSS